MLKKLVEVIMMDGFHHNRYVSFFEKCAEEKTNTLMNWVDETYTELSDIDRVSEMIYSTIDAQQRCMLAKGIVIGLQLGIDCLSEEPSNSNQPS